VVTECVQELATSAVRYRRRLGVARRYVRRTLGYAAVMQSWKWCRVDSSQNLIRSAIATMLLTTHSLGRVHSEQRIDGSSSFRTMTFLVRHGCTRWLPRLQVQSYGSIPGSLVVSHVGLRSQPAAVRHTMTFDPLSVSYGSMRRVSRAHRDDQLPIS